MIAPAGAERAATIERLRALLPNAPWLTTTTVTDTEAAVIVRQPAGPVAAGGACRAPAGLAAMLGVGCPQAPAAWAALRAWADHPTHATTDAPLALGHAGVIAAGEHAFLLMRDRLGSHALYLRRLAHGWAFASSALALAQLEPHSTMAWQGVLDLLTFGQCIDERTLYTDVRALPAGARWVIRGGRLQTAHLEWPAWPATGARLSTRAIEQLAAVDAALAAVPTSPAESILLSGGLDSRLIAALLCRAGRTPRAYTFGSLHSADCRAAQRVAQTLKFEHNLQPTTATALAITLEEAVQLTDGMVPITHFHGTELLATLADAHSLEWNGFAGDALWGDTFLHPRYAVSRHLPDTLFRALCQSAGASGWLDPELARTLRSAPRAHFEAALGRLGEAPNSIESAHRFLMQERIGRLTGPGLALDHHYLPTAAPYADRTVVSFALCMSEHERRHSRLLRRALVECHPELGAIPWPRTGLPPKTGWPVALAWRATRRLARRWRRRPHADALIDYDAWLRTAWNPLRQELLTELATMPGWNGKRLRVLARAPHPRGQAAETAALMTVALALRAWRRQPD